MLSNKEDPGAVLSSSSSSSSSVTSDTVILNFTMCDPSEEKATAEGSQPKRPCHINYEAQALIKKILTTKPHVERIMQEYAITKCLKDATRRQTINILTAAMTEAPGSNKISDSCLAKALPTNLWRSGPPVSNPRL